MAVNGPCWMRPRRSRLGFGHAGGSGQHPKDESETMVPNLQTIHSPLNGKGWKEEWKIK